MISRSGSNSYRITLWSYRIHSNCSWTEL